MPIVKITMPASDNDPEPNCALAFGKNRSGVQLVPIDAEIKAKMGNRRVAYFNAHLEPRWRLGNEAPDQGW